VVLEALRAGYRFASDRLHRFVIDGMADNHAAFAETGAVYYPYVEPRPGEGAGLLEALARRAAIVVTDEFPCFFLPRMLAAAARKLDALGVGLEAIDGNGIYPMHETDRIFTRAFDFRRHLQRRLPEYLDESPRAFPFRGRRLPGYRLPDAVTRRWPRITDELLAGTGAEGLETLAIDHGVAPVSTRGGERAGRKRLDVFINGKLARYHEERNDPDAEAASGLSPYLHFGHVSAHEVFRRVAKAERWSPVALAFEANGGRSGWWGMRPEAESFLDQLVTWRELGYNLCSHRDDYDHYASLPDWAKHTLAVHASDERPYLYSLEQFEQAATHDPLWNAAQRELVREGGLQGYLRMLWGKKILHWSRTAELALHVMIELNNKYALDGRNPNSYSGIFWILGRYDRAWGPERPVFGKVRYMTSESARRKLELRRYLATFGEVAPQTP
jgi:deoxyribodipyrimidine photo-lyase